MTLLEAIGLGDEAEVVKALAGGASASRGKGKRGDVPLLEAIRGGAFAIGRRLLEAGADPNEAEAEGRSALFEAVQARGEHPEEAAALMRLLVTRGAQIDAIALGTSALGWAADLGDLEAVQLLLELGASAAPKKAEESPLSKAFTSEPAAQAIALLLIERGADVNADDPLRSALIFEFDDVAEALLAAGADVTQSEALPAAAGNGRLDWIKRLRALGADVDGMGAIYQAFNGGHTEALTYLLGENTDFDLDDFFRCGMQRAEGDVAIALQQAMPFDDDALQRLLVSASLSKPVGRTMGAWALGRVADVNRPGKDGLAPIHAAVIGGDLAWLEVLLARGADPALALAAPVTVGPLSLPAGATPLAIATRVRKGLEKDRKDPTGAAAVEAALAKRPAAKAAAPDPRPSTPATAGPPWQASIRASLERVARAGGNDIAALRAGLDRLDAADPWDYLMAAIKSCGHDLFSEAVYAAIESSLLRMILEDRRFSDDTLEPNPRHYPKAAGPGLRKGRVVAQADADVFFLWAHTADTPPQVCHAHPESFSVLGTSVESWLDEVTRPLDRPR